MNKTQPAYWKSVLRQLSTKEQYHLKQRLVDAYKCHIIQPKTGETCRQYLKRHAQRLPKPVKANYQGAYSSKQYKSTKKEKEELRDQIVFWVMMKNLNQNGH